MPVTRIQCFVIVAQMPAASRSPPSASALGCRPVDYVPLIRMVEQGKIDVKRQVTHRFSLDEIGKAFEVMKEGVSLRSIVIP